MKRSTQLDLNQYKTDKVENRYLEKYDVFFERYINQYVVLLELGVQTGSSLMLWKDYFPNGIIVGIDTKIPDNLENHDRIRMFEGNQTDVHFLSSVAEKNAPYGFDIIIDDASHIAEYTKISFWHLFANYLKPGGIYVIEDWGTGFWSNFIDGRDFNHRPHKKNFFDLRRRKMLSHDYGSVGFVKQLIDELGAWDYTKYWKERRGSQFESIAMYHGMAFIQKAYSID